MTSISALEQMTGGRYRPSPGSVYPTLQLLEDGGYATSEAVDGKRVYTITDAGLTLLKEKAPEVEPDRVEEDDLRSVFFKLAEAVKQAASVAGPADQGKLREILTGGPSRDLQSPRGTPIDSTATIRDFGSWADA